MVSRRLATGAAVVGLLAFVAGPGTRAEPVRDVSPAVAEDPVAGLMRRLESGQVRLPAREGLGFVPAVMAALGMQPDSQALVFAKNSLQSVFISPRTPRAIYFNDRVYLGYIPQSDLVELIAVDPIEGLQFYTFRNIHAADPPRLERQPSMCGPCHGRGAEASLLISSVIPNKDGRPFLAVKDTGPVSTDHRTPLERRWGGWYVTGAHGSQRHMGNAVARLPFYPFDLEQDGTQNLMTLAGKVDTAPYPSHTSDIVALMTLEHQVRMTNLILRMGQRSRGARAGVRPDTPPAKTLDQDIEELVAYMLFADEAPLRAPVRGSSTFAASFQQRGPRDRRGRSLRDFDLNTRLFRYALSYTIYGAEFDAIAAPVRTQIYRRLYDVLSSRDASPAFARLSTAERRAALEIMRDTKRNLPPFWTRPAAAR
jgi:hypothetical protein